MIIHNRVLCNGWQRISFLLKGDLMMRTSDFFYRGSGYLLFNKFQSHQLTIAKAASFRREGWKIVSPYDEMILTQRAKIFSLFFDKLRNFSSGQGTSFISGPCTRRARERIVIFHHKGYYSSRRYLKLCHFQVYFYLQNKIVKVVV